MKGRLHHSGDAVGLIGLTEADVFLDGVYISVRLTGCLIVPGARYDRQQVELT